MYQPRRRMNEEEAKKDALDAESRLEWYEMAAEGRDYCGNKWPTKPTIAVDTKLRRMFRFGRGFACEKLPYSDPTGKDGQVKQLCALNQQLRKFGTVTATNFDDVMDAMIGRQRLFIGDAQYELHCEMGSQYRERLQLEEFQAQLTDLQQMKAAGAHMFAKSFGISCGISAATKQQYSPRVYPHSGGGAGGGGGDAADEASPEQRQRREAAAARAAATQRRTKKGSQRGGGKGKKGGGGNSGGGGGGGLGQLLGVVGSKMGIGGSSAK